MDSESRYEIIETIGSGDFATVYYARDHELQRDVAIKQIHAEYLADPAKTERYWQEAQLLASLEHPYVITIYDISRERGWLILERMRGSLKEELQGQPIDLDFLRVALICSLHALRVLEQNNIVHGDIKPGNLLLDKNNRVKIGDFGLARRVTGDDGSLVKGTTKYMAPEVVSDQFGPVGAHSDLYSLGFTAYELMCGSHFDSLFPGLDMFGRDRQIAWIMWHAALDRKLPEIDRVLEGVPADLSMVITRLTEKDPNKRYRSAEDALADLRQQGNLPDKGPTTTQIEEQKQQAAAERKRRRLAIGALCVSLLLSAAVLFIPSGEKVVVQEESEKEPTDGIIRDIYLETHQFHFEPEDGSSSRRVIINSNSDGILLDNKKVSLEQLAPGDVIHINRLTSEDGKKILEIIATRNVEEESGQITKIRGNERTIFFKSSNGDSSRLYFPRDLAIRVNDMLKFEGRKFTLEDLQPGDRLTVRHVPKDDRRRAVEVNLRRTVPFEGFVVRVDGDNNRLAIRAGMESDAEMRVLPLSASCTIALQSAKPNNRRSLSLTELKTNDRVHITHDTEIKKIDVFRDYVAQGTVQKVDLSGKRLVVDLEKPKKRVTFTLAENCPVVRTDTESEDSLSFVRAGDTVSIDHASHTLVDPKATRVEVTPRPNTNAWAAIVGCAQYDDKQLPPLGSAAADAGLLRDALVERYRIPDQQIVIERDPSSAQAERVLRQYFSRIPAGGQLIVYVVCHGLLDPQDNPILALRQFSVANMETTGFPLKDLISAMERSDAAEKLLLLDTSHKWTGNLASREVSTAKFVAAAKPSRHRPVSSSVTVIASCGPGQHGNVLPGKGQGLFASALATGFSGEADADRDYRISGDELFAYLQQSTAKLGAANNLKQTPVRFLPDDRPAVLTAKAQTVVRSMLRNLDKDQVDYDRLKVELDSAQQLAPSEPDFQIATALILLKHSRTVYSQRMFEQILDRHPDQLIAHHGLTWQEFLKGNYTEGVNHLITLLRDLPDPVAGQSPDPYAQHLFLWAGQLRGFLSNVASDTHDVSEMKLAELNSVIVHHGEVAKKLYRDGYSEVSRKARDLDEKLKDAVPAVERKLKLDRKRLTYYASFDFEQAANFLRSNLDR